MLRDDIMYYNAHIFDTRELKISGQFGMAGQVGME